MCALARTLSIERLIHQPPINPSTRVTSNNPDDQRGLTQMLRGIVPAFRNSTHHHIINFSREEAMRICGFVDVLLGVVDNAVKLR